MPTGVLLPGTFHRESEFQLVPTGVPNAGRWLTGSCGPNALSMAESWSKQLVCTTVSVYAVMVARGWCDANGVSNINQLADAAGVLGLPVVDHYWYGGDTWAGWAPWVLGHLQADRACLIEVAYGQALKDVLTGLGQNATNLHYHFITLVGFHPGGFSQRAGRVLPVGCWACDGDNLARGDVLQFYPQDVLNAALPCAALAIEALAAPATSPVITSDATQEIPSMSYSYNSGSDRYTDSESGLSIGSGLYVAALKKGYTSTGLLLGEETDPLNPANTFAVFGSWGGTDHVLVWRKDLTPPQAEENLVTGHIVAHLYQVYQQEAAAAQSANAGAATLKGQVGTLTSQNSTLTSENGALQAQIAQLQAQVKQLEAAAAQTPPSPPTPPSDPNAEAALVAVRALQSAIAQIEAVPAAAAASGSAAPAPPVSSETNAASSSAA